MFAMNKANNLSFPKKKKKWGQALTLQFRMSCIDTEHYYSATFRKTLIRIYL